MQHRSLWSHHASSPACTRSIPAPRSKPLDHFLLATQASDAKGSARVLARSQLLGPTLCTCAAACFQSKRSARKACARSATPSKQHRVVFVTSPQGEKCPWGDPENLVIQTALGFDESVTWSDAVRHLAKKVIWAGAGDLIVEVVEAGTIGHQTPTTMHVPPSLVMLVNLTESQCQGSLQYLSSENPEVDRQNVLVLSAFGEQQGSSPISQLTPRYAEEGKTPAQTIVARCLDLWQRATTEDAFYAVLFAIHFAVAAVPLVSQAPAVDTLAKFATLCSRCAKEAVDSVLDGNAMACLACQSGCDLRDQTQQYRCTVSYESPALARLVRCFERRGIFDCAAEAPRLPEVLPLSHFRGSRLTYDSAWTIMMGHIGMTGVCSWKPVLGQNPAYDYFPCQYNTWYKDARGQRGWYDPVFQVQTFSGDYVWRKRHYRVRPGPVAGSFMLSTEDNGISLQELWRIVDADDDMEWAVLHYAGAARSVGQSYAGSLLVTKDGLPPTASNASRIRRAFASAGVEAFELYSIPQESPADLSACGPAPLTVVEAANRRA